MRDLWSAHVHVHAISAVRTCMRCALSALLTLYGVVCVRVMSPSVGGLLVCGCSRRGCVQVCTLPLAATTVSFGDVQRRRRRTVVIPSEMSAPTFSEVADMRCPNQNDLENGGLKCGIMAIFNVLIATGCDGVQHAPQLDTPAARDYAKELDASFQRLSIVRALLTENNGRKPKDGTHLTNLHIDHVERILNAMVFTDGACRPGRWFFGMAVVQKSTRLCMCM